MKKIIAAILCLVMIFSFAVPSFAVDVTISNSQWVDVINLLDSFNNYSEDSLGYQKSIFDYFYKLYDNGSLSWEYFYNQGSMPSTQVASGSWFWTVLKGFIDIKNELTNGTIPSKLTSMLEQNLSIMESLNYVPKLFTTEWDTFSDSWFNKTFLQNKIVSDNVSNLITGWNKGDLITSPGDYSESWYYWVFDNLNGMYENSELFEDIYLEKNSFSTLELIPQNQAFYLVNNTRTFAESVTTSLSNIGRALTQQTTTSFDNPFSSLGKTSVNTSYGMLYNMLQHLNVHSGFLARLAYVLADDEEIRLNETLQDSKTEVVDFVGNGITSSNGSSLSLMSGITDSISFSSDFFDFFDVGVSLDDVWFLFEDAEAFSWFTEETASNIDTVPVTYSRKSNPQTEIVTSYYEDRQAEFAEKWGALIG